MIFAIFSGLLMGELNRRFNIAIHVRCANSSALREDHNIAANRHS